MFRDRLIAAGLEQHAPALDALARPSIRLRPLRDPQVESTIGASRIGGVPDLPSSIDWPRYDGVSQSFIAQVNLDEIQPFDAGGVLPSRGLLSFFYDSQQRVWGFDPAERDAWKIVYTPEIAECVPRELPVDVSHDGRFAAVRLRPERELTYAPWEFSEVAALGLTREQRFAYADAIEEDDGVIHRLLGHPQPIQGDMQLECQLVSHGLYCGDSRGYDDPRARELAPSAVDWRLLLQIDSDEDAGMMWGDVGRIYYWMHADDLRARAWEKAWLVLQCS